MDLFSMTTDELLDLRNKIDTLLERRDSSEAALLYSLIERKAMKQGVRFPPFHVLRGSVKGKYNKLALELKNQYNVTGSDMILLFDIFAEIMLSYLDSISVPISPKTVVENADKFDSLMGSAFPMYHRKLFELRRKLNGKGKVNRKSKKDK